MESSCQLERGPTGRASENELGELKDESLLSVNVSAFLFDTCTQEFVLEFQSFVNEWFRVFGKWHLWRLLIWELKVVEL